MSNLRLPPAKRPSRDGEKVDALQKVADAASAFAERALSDSFEKAAAESGQTIQASPDFDRSGATLSAGAEVSQAPAPDLKNFAPSAFLLTDSRPISDVIQSGDAFFVLKLTRVNPQRPLTIEEVRPIAERRLGARKAEGLLRETAEAALVRIREAISAGKSFADAAAAAGLQVQSLNDLLPSSGTLSPKEQEVAAATMLMEPGQLSAMIPNSDAGFAVYLSARAPVMRPRLRRTRI